MTAPIPDGLMPATAWVETVGRARLALADGRVLEPLEHHPEAEALAVAARARLVVRLHAHGVAHDVYAISSPEFCIVGVPVNGGVSVVLGDNAGLPVALARLVDLQPRPRAAVDARRSATPLEEDVSAWGPEARVWALDVSVAQGREPFPRLTVVDSPFDGYWRVEDREVGYVAEPTNAESLWRQLACLSLAPYQAPTAD